MQTNMRNEVFNSKRLSLDINTANLNSFTLKPIRAEEGRSQVCVTFNKSLVNAVSFYVSYRRKGAENWINTSPEHNLNVINVKNIEPGVYEFRIVAVTSKQQTPSVIKEVEIQEVPVKGVTHAKSQKIEVSQTIRTIASNLADDIIAEVYFNLSNPDFVKQQSGSPFYESSVKY